MTPSTRPTLSVVLITRNQEWNVARLVESVLAHSGAGEVILVDSASTDRTVEKARAYPITVIRLDDNQRLTAAIGRHVGYLHTTGDNVLFLDGDMELVEGWVDHALTLLRTASQVAVVSGLVLDLPKDGEHDDRLPTGSDATAMEVEHGGGAALYRRSVLEEVGGFKPHLYGDEEPELCLRIRRAGYRVVRLRYPIVYHRTDPVEYISTLLARRRRNLYLGYGQNLRAFLGSDLFLPYARERGQGIAPAAGVLAGVASLLWALRGGRALWFALWCLALLALGGALALRKRSLYQSLYTIVRRLMIMDGTVRGFLLAPEPANGAPVFQIVQALQPGGVHAGA